MTSAYYRDLLKILVWSRPLIRVFAFPVRVGILTALRVDLSEMSMRMAVSYLQPEQATRLGYDQLACGQLRQMRDRLFRTYRQLGGQASVPETILKRYATIIGEILMEMAEESDHAQTS